MSKTIDYLKEVRAEINHVTWPTRMQTIYFTVAVIIVSGVIAYYLGFLDYVFSRGLDWLLRH